MALKDSCSAVLRTCSAEVVIARGTLLVTVDPMAHTGVLCCSCALFLRPRCKLLASSQARANTRAFKSYISQKQQVQTQIVCCNDSAADHSSHDSGHSSHASDRGSSSRTSWSSNHSSSDNSTPSSRHDSNNASSSHSPSASSHQSLSAHKRNHSNGDPTPSSSDSDHPFDDTALDVASMFDTTETDNASIQYRPSSDSYYKQPEQPSNSDFWAYKPVWCQPWSILASGMAFVAGARWITGGSTVATVVAAVPILVWWYLFLVLVPADFRKYAEK